MRALLCAAVLMGGCSSHAHLHLSFVGTVSDHSHARMPRSYVGLRLSLIHSR